MKEAPSENLKTPEPGELYLEVLRDAVRYKRLRTLGCAVMGTPQLQAGTVSRFTNLDEIVDADIEAHPERG